MEISHRLPIFCCLFLVLYMLFNGEDACGDELKPEWHTSANYKIILSVKDKWSVEKTYKAKYVVKTSPNLTFISEREGTSMDSTSAKVVFPDDFIIPETDQKAWLDFNGKESTWEIYVNGQLMENGTFVFKRSKANDLNAGH